MLSVSLEVQMDTQRAIRQEVAAVFSAFMTDYLMPRQQHQQQLQQMTPTQRSGHAAMERLGQQPQQHVAAVDAAATQPFNNVALPAQTPYQPSKPVDSGSCVICVEKS